MNGIIPVVIMGKAPQRGLDAPDDQRNIPVGLPDQLTVDGQGTVRPSGGAAARGIDI